jgi:CheY-specific phosphatase CheX
MPLPKSPTAPELVAPELLEALTHVAESSLFAFCDACPADAFVDLLATRSALVAGAPPLWLRAVTHFRGHSCGWVELTLPIPLAEELCAAFAGGEESLAERDGAARDFVGELANMLCGLWLTRTARQYLFDIAPPSVTTVTDAHVTEAMDDDQGVLCQCATVNDAPVLLRVRTAIA